MLVVDVTAAAEANSNVAMAPTAKIAMTVNNRRFRVFILKFRFISFLTSTKKLVKCRNYPISENDPRFLVNHT